MATQQQGQYQVAPKTSRLRTEQLQRALQRHEYVRVGDNRTGQLLLSGAPDRWARFPNDIYIPELRVAGDPNVITQALLNAGYDINTINAYIQGAYNAQNYQAEKREAFQGELQALRAYQQQQKQLTAQRQPGVTLSQLQALPSFGAPRGGVRVQGAPQAPSTARVTTRRTTGAIGTGRPGTSRRKSLRDHVNEAMRQPGNVVDISNYDKIRTVTRPKTVRGRFGLTSLPIISSNRENVVRALAELGMPQLIGEWDAAANQARQGLGQQVLAPQQVFVPQQQAFIPQQQAFIPQQQAFIPQQQYIPQQTFIPQQQAFPTIGLQSFAPQQQQQAFPTINLPQGTATLALSPKTLGQGLQGIRNLGQQLQQPMVNLPVQNINQGLPTLANLGQVQALGGQTAQLPMLQPLAGGPPQQLNLANLPTIGRQR